MANDPRRDPADAPYSAAQMLAELAFPSTPGRDAHVAFQGGFVFAVDPIIALLFEATPSGQGETAFASRHLAARIINDLVASVHLTMHGYLNQAYGALRMAYEACDLLELVGSNPTEAESWVNTEKGWTEFSPANVRLRLGRSKVDAIYSHLSEHAHPRFAASRLSSYGRVRADAPADTNPQIIIQLGPFLVDEHPALWHAAILVTQVTGTLALRASHLVHTGAIDAPAWDRAVALTAHGVQEMASAAAAALAELGFDDGRDAVNPYFTDPWAEQAEIGRSLRATPDGDTVTGR